MQAILRNTKNQKFPPILVVSFTNRALDQFLEGLLPICGQIVRIGGRSKNEILKKCIVDPSGGKCPSAVLSAKIIGMTTTGAAKYRHIIDRVNPKIVREYYNSLKIKFTLGEILYNIYFTLL